MSRPALMDLHRSSGLGRLAALDDELLEDILLQLQPADLCSAACASTALHILCSEEPLWQAIALRRDFATPLRYMGNWRATVCWLITQQASWKAQKQPGGSPSAGFVSDGDPGCSHGADEAEVKVAFMDRPRPLRQIQSMYLYRRWYRCNVDMSSFEPQQQAISPISGAGMTPAMFRDQIEAADRPACLEGLVDEWPARRNWTIDGLLERCGCAAFQVSRPRHCGGKIKMLLKDYVEYMRTQQDEEPLYIFDSEFIIAAPMLTEDYEPPRLFEQDHFCHLGDKRPDYRWLVLGPPRSGAGWHVDPQLTSAWNTLLIGRKRWAAYPPGRVPPGVHISVGDSGEVDVDEPSALRWFLDVYPNIPEAERPLEWVQHAGETVFVPGGWWHIVLNLETTVAVTHNFVSDVNLERVTRYMSCGDAAQYLGPEAEAALGLWCNKPTAQTTEEPPSEKITQLEDRNADEGVVDCDGDDEWDVGDEEDDGDGGDLGMSSMTFCTRMRRRGFLRDRKLGLWLRLLWERSSGHPNTRRQLLSAAEDHCDAGLWREALASVCERLGRSRHIRPHEALPVYGGSTVVFKLGPDDEAQGKPQPSMSPRELSGSSGRIVVKFYCKRHLAAANESLACEVEAYKAVGSAMASLLERRESPHRVPAPASAWTELRDVLPSLLLDSTSSESQPRGVVVRWDVTENSVKAATGACHHHAPLQNTYQTPSEASSQTELPFMAITLLPGEPLSMLRRRLQKSEWKEIAAFLGRNLAALHSLPLTTHRTFWQEMDDTVVRSQRCRCHNEHQTKERCDMSDGGCEAWVRSWAPWEPFCSFFTKRRKAMWGTLTESGLLPEQLCKELPSYLPEDASALVMSDGTNISSDDGAAAAPLAPPCLLHGDPTGFNLLLAEKSAQCQQAPDGDGDSRPSATEGGFLESPSALSSCWRPSALVDLGDVGHGDPLYDVVTLHMEVFRCNSSLLALFLQAYRDAHADIGAGGRCWLGPCNKRLERLPKVAMCYVLLHKQELVSRIWKEFPGAWEAKKWCEVEELVWGTLVRTE